MRKYWILVLLIAGAILLRFWAVPELFAFGIDEEYQSTLAATIVKDFHVIWIGVSAAGTGFYLGPAYTYLNALLFWFSKGDPVILGYFSSFVGVILTILIYLITDKLYGRKAALISTILYGFSALMVFYDRRFWNPSFIPFISLLMFYVLSQLQKNSKWLIVLAILIGASFHVHLSLLAILPVVLFVVIANFKTIKKINWLLAGVAYILVTSPLLVFDYYHKYSNLLAPINMLRAGGGSGDGSYLLIAHLQEIFSTLGRVWALNLSGISIDESVPGPMLLKTQGPLILVLLSVVILVLFIVKKKDDSQKILLGMISFFLLSFVFYPGKVFEYYLLGFFPLFAIMVGLVLQRVNTKVMGALLSVFVVYNSYTVLTTSQNYGLTSKKELIKQVSRFVGDNSFYLATAGSYRAYGGWRYLFSAYGRTPAQSQSDEMFGWLYPKEISSVKSKYKVVISDGTYKEEKQLKEFTSGGFKATIINYE